MEINTERRVIIIMDYDVMWFLGGSNMECGLSTCGENSRTLPFPSLTQRLSQGKYFYSGTVHFLVVYRFPGEK